ncbi:MAG TPA: cytochrome c [Terriglobales bacterium]|nr:cytochrome c [Terriglobales bacterium]
MKNAAVVLVIAMALAGTTCLAAESGADVFKSKCASCHGPDGSGNTPVGKSLKLRDLSSAEVQAQSEADIKTIIEKGKGKMPGYSGKLSPEQIDAVAKYVKSLKK